jgi:phosphoglycerate dehydrogenase-like enzyme
VLVVSGLWRNELVSQAGRLRFIQSISAGTDQYDRTLLQQNGIRLASAQGANERAVAEHAMALILALTRHLHHGRDRQREKGWRPMISDRNAREAELEGKVLVVIGLGRIGSRLATLARAFDLRVIGVKRDTSSKPDFVDEIIHPDRLAEVLPLADFIALTTPLTRETRGIIGPAQFAAMKRSAYLINVARGPVVDEAALIAALQSRQIAGAGLDCFEEEPLPPSSPLWTFENAIITPHSAGETQRYEAKIVDLLLDNLNRLRQDGQPLRNQIV